MVDLHVNEKYIADLKDDFFINEENTFYEFIEDDPVTAFYLGFYYEEWFNLLNSIEKQYLYSKDARHSSEYLVDYMEQFQFWINKFNASQNKETIDLVEMSEYVINNFIWLEEADEKYIVDLAFLLGVSCNKTNKK